MSRMLVAYAKCGCLVSAVLDCDGDYASELEAEMISDAKAYGWTLQHEERDAVESSPCEKHSLAAAKGGCGCPVPDCQHHRGLAAKGE